MGSKSPYKKPTYPLANVVKTPLRSLTGSLYHLLIQEPSPTPSPHSLGLYNSAPRNTFASFFEAIDRQDDTFYVVSFSGDHLLVPATNQTKSGRVRMSLLLPAVISPNASQSQPDSVAMMKIDCQVLNTTMVHIMKDAIPVHMSGHFRQANTSEDLDQMDEEDEEVQEELLEESRFPGNYRNTERKDSKQKRKDNLTLSDSLLGDDDVKTITDDLLGEKDGGAKLVDKEVLVRSIRGRRSQG